MYGQSYAVLKSGKFIQIVSPAKILKTKLKEEIGDYYSNVYIEFIIFDIVNYFFIFLNFL